jgi:uncharacterized membrane protein
VFHQLLQFHNMLSAKYPPTSIVNLEVNMFWDGVFHVLTWIITAIGIGMLWRTVQQREVTLSSRALVGAQALGWGLFNLVEGIINHHILHFHHVREGDKHLIWDLAFLMSGALLMSLGWILIRSASRAHAGSKQVAVERIRH